MENSRDLNPGIDGLLDFTESYHNSYANPARGADELATRWKLLKNLRVSEGAVGRETNPRMTFSFVQRMGATKLSLLFQRPCGDRWSEPLIAAEV